MSIKNLTSSNIKPLIDDNAIASDIKNKKNLSRRGFLKLSSLATGAVVFAPTIALADKFNHLATIDTYQPNFFLTLRSDGIVEFAHTRLEMGQTPGTGLINIIAEELDYPFEKIQLKQVQYNAMTAESINKINGGVTGGSRSIRASWPIIAESCARVRMLMIDAAASIWSVTADNCTVQEGQVINKGSGQKLSYAQLLTKAESTPQREQVDVKKRGDYQKIGRPRSNVLTKDIITGQLRFNLDHHHKDMVFAAIARCPYRQGDIKSVSQASKDNVLNMPGVLEIIEVNKKEFIGFEQKSEMVAEANVRAGLAVIARSTWAAFAGAKALEIEWQTDMEMEDNESLMARYHAAIEKEGNSLFALGNAKRHFQQNKQQYSQLYQVPFNTHQYMEPLNATAHYKNGFLELWAGTQCPRRDVEAIATVVGLAKEKIKVNVSATGGSFGRKFVPDFTCEAAYLAKKLSTPVMVVWTREDEVSLGRQGNMELQQLAVTLSDDHLPSAYHWKTVQSEGDTFWGNPYMLHLNNVKHELVHEKPTLDLAPWRAVFAARNNLGWECFVDELAKKADMDPLAYRLKLLAQPVQYTKAPEGLPWLLDYAQNVRLRYANALQNVADRIQWQKTRKANTGVGIAAANFSGTIATNAVEIEIIENNIRINKIIAVVDCGVVVNPNTAEQQVVGSIIWGLTALFKQETQFKNSQITQTNFHDAQVFKMHEVPEIEVHFMATDSGPGGLGEPGACAIAPAILNAIFSITGERIRKRPLTEYSLVSA